MFWTENSIRWYRQATEYTEYHKEIVKEIAPFIHKDDTVCDLGCGLGYLSVGLSKISKQVTAIDIHDKALRIVEQNVKQNDIENIEIIKGDLDELPRTPQWDIAVVSFVKYLPEEIISLLKLCKKQLIVIVSNGSEQSFLPKEQAQRHFIRKADVLEKGLEANGMKFRMTKRALDFGQPFPSKEEAAQFIGHYANESSPQEIDDHLATFLETVEPDRNGNHYFLSNVKEIGIFVIDKE